MSGPTPALPGLTIDIVANVLAQTLFSPFFCAFIPVVIAGQAKSWDGSAVVWTTGWAALLCLTGVLRYVNRVYAAAGSWFFLPPKLNWSEQIVLITGGGSGIGALLAETLAIRNVTVVILDLKFPEGGKANDNTYAYTCDVSDYSQVQACADKIRKEVGDPTVIVNNAGVMKGKLLLDLTEADIRSTFGANTLAHYWILKAFLPAMLSRGTGHIVMVASVLGLIGTAQMTDYCASKAAVVNLHQSLRYELDTRYKTPQIRTTLVLPSFISTPLFSLARMPHHSYPSFGGFFCPPVYPPELVKAIIFALNADESRVIRLPLYSHLARFLGGGVNVLPKWIIDGSRWVSGADWAMSGYGPKPDAGERLEVERKARKGDEKVNG